MVNSPNASDPKDRTRASAPDDSDDSGVIDAEIVQESEPEPEAMAPKMMPPASDGRKKSGKAGWIAALILLAFIGGLFAAPYARSGLEYLGLSAPASISNNGFDGEGLQAQSTALQSQISDLSGDVTRLQEILVQQLAQIDVAAQERQQIKSDISLLATSAGSADAPLNGGSDSAAAARIESEFVRLNNEIARLSALQTTPDPDVATLKGSLALARAETIQVKTKVEALETLMNSLQTGAINSSPRGRLVLTLGRLKDQARAGLAFGADLAGLKVDIAELPALDQQLLGAEFAVLARNGDGIQSYEELVRSYEDVARAVKRAQEKQEGGFLANLFTVRRTDENATGIDAILLDAEKRLAVQDVKGAVAVLASLEGTAATTSAEWRAAATAHVETITAIDRMMRAVAGSGTPAGGRR